MKLSRRGFFRLAGGAAAVAITAPAVQQLSQAAAFIRPENLEMGVPHAVKPLVPTIWSRETDRLMFGPTSIAPTLERFGRVKQMGDYSLAFESTFEPGEQRIIINRHHYSAFGIERVAERRPSPLVDGWQELVDKPGHTRAEYRRALADSLDRSYEEEIRRWGEPMQLSDREIALKLRALAGGEWPWSKQEMERALG